MALAAVLTYLFARSFAATGTAVFTVEPVDGAVSQGSTYELMLYVTPADSDIKSAQVAVTIPSQLEYQSFDSSGSSFSLASPVSGDSVGSTKVTVVAGYTGTSSGPSGSKLYIGKLVTTATTLGSGSVTLTDVEAQVPSEDFMTVSTSGASVTVNPPPQPDLVVTSITASPAAPSPNQQVTFSATIENRGNLATPSGTPHSVQFTIGSTTLVSSAYTGPLAAGASTTVTASTQWTAVVGTNTVTAMVDNTNTISESDESNNSFSSTVTVDDNSSPVVAFTFPGASEVLSGNSILISSIPQVVVRPALSDDVGVTSESYQVNGTAVSLTNGEHALPNQNGDYAFRVTAADAAGNSLDETITVRSRHPDISRDGTVGLVDFTRMALGWGGNDIELDLDANGTVGLSDFTRLLINWDS